MTLPTITIGWLLPCTLSEELHTCYSTTRKQVKTYLSSEFPQFNWQLKEEVYGLYPAVGKLDILPLLELGLTEKHLNNWDLTMVIVPNDLIPMRRIVTLGVPSSKLDVAVASSARLGSGGERVQGLMHLTLHLLGRLLSLRIASSGPMQPITFATLKQRLRPFPDNQKTALAKNCQRLISETQSPPTSRWWGFVYLQALFSRPIAGLVAVLSYRPWAIPLMLTRSISAVIISLLFFMTSAESWEAGVYISNWRLTTGAVVAILLATLAVFFGQHLNQVGRGRGLTVERARQQLIILTTLFLSMGMLWVGLRFIVFLLAQLLPLDTVAGWAKVDSEVMRSDYGWYASFMANIGVLAAMLGANLEKEEEVKALFYFDHEI